MSRIPYAELRQNQLFQIGPELYKTSTVYPSHVTAQLLYPKPDRTEVHTIRRVDYENKARKASRQIIHKMEDAWNFEGSVR